MVLGVGQPELEFLQVHTCSHGQTRGMTGARSLHLVGTPEVESCGNVKLAGGDDVYADVEVVHQYAASFRLLADVVVVFRTPTGEIDHCHCEADGRVPHALGEAKLKVEGQALVVVAECLYLSAEVCRYGRKGEIVVGVVIVQAQIDSHGKGGVGCVFGVDELAGSSAHPFVAQFVAVHAAESHIDGSYIAQYLARFRGLLHRAVAHELCGGSPCAPFSLGADECGTARLAPFHVGHEVQVHAVVADAGQHGGILENKRCVVLDGRNVFTAQCNGVSRSRQ